MNPSRLAVVAGDQQVWTMSASGADCKQLTFGEGPGAQNPWGMLRSRDHSSWPCWSPDGQWITCFQHRVGSGDEGHIWLAALQVDGVEEQRLVDLNETIPIYAQWAADSKQIAVLCQDETSLSLRVAELGAVGKSRLMEEGTPLFFSWTGDAERLLIHSGSAGDTRLVVRDVRGGSPDEHFARGPGNFCTPLVVGNQAVFVGRDEQHGVLCVSDLAGKNVQGVTGVEGLVAVVVSPTGTQVAFSGAPPGNRQPYQGLWVADLEAGRVRKIFEHGVVAFFWMPDGQRLAVVTHGRGPAQLHWNEVDVATGEHRPLAGFYPSMDQKFFLHYFEQFAVSHRPISSDGSRLVFSSHPNPRGRSSDTTPHICMIDLDSEDARTDVCIPGDFGVFSA